jgi:hypothetical protein
VSTLKIERDKWYLTRSGKKRRVICVDVPDKMFPVIVVDEAGCVSPRTADGCFYTTGSCAAPDLVAEYVPPKKPEVRYVNIYEDSGFSTCASRHREYVEGYRHNRGYVRTVQMVEVTPEVEAALKEKGVEY